MLCFVRFERGYNCIINLSEGFDELRVMGLIAARYYYFLSTRFEAFGLLNGVLDVFI